MAEGRAKDKETGEEEDRGKKGSSMLVEEEMLFFLEVNIFTGAGSHEGEDMVSYSAL